MDNVNVIIVLAIVLLVLVAVYVAQFGFDLGNPLGLFGAPGGGNPEDQTSQGSGEIPSQPLESKSPPGGSDSGVPLQITVEDTNETEETNESKEQEMVTVNVTDGGLVGDVQREVEPGGADRIDFVIT